MQDSKLQFIEDAIIQLNEHATHDTLEMVLTSPKIAKAAIPGQFIMVSCARTGHSPLLRRPLSIHDVNGDEVSLLYKVIGAGTEIMSHMRVGDSVSLLGPLGTGFTVGKTKRHCLVGGGIGMAPLLHLSKLIKETDPDAIITTLEGVRSKQDVLVIDKFKPFGDVAVSTDDGTEGHHGFVTEIMDKLSLEDTTVYTCGPVPMMKGVAAIATGRGCDCQISMETHMACGMGACLGCSYPRAGNHDGVEKYIHTCKDGPVMNSTLIWE